MDHSIPEHSSRSQKIDKAALLSLCPLFSGLSAWEIKSISQLMRLVEYKKDEVIYREGESAENFYVVVAGRLEAHVTAGGKRKTLAYLKRGDYFGEMSLLTKEPHSATIQSLSDTMLLALKKEDFERTIEHNAAISVEISRRLSARLTGNNRSRALRSDVISLFSNARKIGRFSFSLNLAATLFHETHQKTILFELGPEGTESCCGVAPEKRVGLDRFQGMEGHSVEQLGQYLYRHPSGFDVLSVVYNEPDKVSEDRLISLLNFLAIDYRFILIDLPGQIDEVSHKTLSQSDAIYFVTDNSINNIMEIQELVTGAEKDFSFAPEKISIVIHEAFMGIRTTASARRELFGSRFCYSLPAVAEAPEDREPGRKPYAIEDPEADYSRVVRHIARRVCNHLVGLVLGSGAALGLAHIGVLKVLEREKIPVDIVAGSSIGALVGALHAVGKTADEIEKAALEISSAWAFLSLLDFCLVPLRGIFAGRLVMKKYKKHLGEKTFDDCRIPLKIMAANLSTHQAIVMDSGYVADAVRISIAIPAIFTPVIVNKEVVIDGGILSPLPVHAVHSAGANKVVAVNVFPSSKDMLERKMITEEAEEKRMQLIRQKNIIARGWYRLKRGVMRRFSPNIFDVLMNTIQTMETEISEIESTQADVLIRPIVTMASWVDFFKPQQFIKKGEEEALKALPKIKALVSQQNV